MESKIDKLKELAELVKSGIVTQEEFEKLKIEILKSNEDLDNNQDVSYHEQNSSNIKNTVSNKERIVLRPFYDDIGTEIMPPKLNYIDFENISESDIQMLKPFLKNKYLHALSEFTNDEIRLAEKLLTNSEIDFLDNDGFNYRERLPYKKMENRNNGESGNSLIVTGYVLAFMSFIILPIAFTLAGIGIGIVNMSKGRNGHGIAQISISVAGGYIGTMLGGAGFGL